jgi:hypothetical protein
MKKYLALLILALSCFFAPASQGQNFSTVTASKIQDASGSLLANGTISPLGVGANNQPISFEAGGGGQVITEAPIWTVTNGAIVGTKTLANSLYTNPVGVQYQFTITDSSTQNTTVLCCATVSGSTWSLDTWIPTGVYTLPSTGPSSITGSLTVSGPTTIGGTLSVAGTTTLAGLGAGNTTLTQLLLDNPGSSPILTVATMDDGAGNKSELQIKQAAVAGQNFEIIDAAKTGTGSLNPILLGENALSVCLGNNPGTGPAVDWCLDANGDFYPLGNATIGYSGTPVTAIYAAKVYGTGDPTTGLQLATKNYVDAHSGGGGGGGAPTAPTGVAAQVYATSATPSTITCTGISQTAGTATATGCTFTNTSVFVGLLVTTTTSLGSPYTAYNVTGATITAVTPSTSGVGTVSYAVTGSPAAYSGSVVFSTTLAATLTNDLALQQLNANVYASQSTSGGLQNGIHNAASAYGSTCSLVVGVTTPPGCITGSSIIVDASYGGYGLGSGTPGAYSEDVAISFPACPAGTGYCGAATGNFSSNGQTMGSLTALPFNTTVFDQRGGADYYIYHDPFSRFFNQGSTTPLNHNSGSGDSGLAQFYFFDYVAARGNSQLIPIKKVLSHFAGGQNGEGGFGNKTNMALEYDELLEYSRGQHQIRETEQFCNGMGDCMGDYTHQFSSAGLARGGDEGQHRGDAYFGEDTSVFSGYIGSGSFNASSLAQAAGSSGTFVVTDVNGTNNQGEGRYLINLTQTPDTLKEVLPVYTGTTNLGTCTQESSTATTAIATGCSTLTGAAPGNMVSVSGLSGYNTSWVPITAKYSSVTGTCTFVSQTSNIATATGCTQNGNVAVGASITFTSFGVSAYNVTAVVTAVGTGTITYPVTGSPAASTSTGSFTTSPTFVYALSGNPAPGTTTLSWSATSPENMRGSMQVTAFINNNNTTGVPPQMVTSGYPEGASTLIGATTSGIGNSVSGGNATAASMTGTTATLTVPTSAGVAVGGNITVANFVSPYTAYNGTYAVTAVTPTTISYTILGAPGNVTGASATWTETASFAPYAGTLSITTGVMASCTTATQASGTATLGGCSGSESSMVVGKTIVVSGYSPTTPSYNGTFTVTGNTGTTVSYALSGSPGSATASASNNVYINDKCSLGSYSCSGTTITNSLICVSDSDSIDWGYVTGGPYTVANNIATFEVSGFQRQHGNGALVSQGGTCGYFQSEDFDAYQVYVGKSPSRLVLPLAGSPSATQSYYWYTTGGSYTAPLTAGNSGPSTSANSGWLYYSKSSVASTWSGTGNIAVVTTPFSFQGHPIGPAGTSYGNLNGQTLVVTGGTDGAIDGTYTVQTSTLTGPGQAQITNYSSIQLWANGTLTLSSATGATFVFCNCTATTYPGAEVTGVYNAAASRVDGTLAIGASGINWNLGDIVEEPHWHQPYIGTSSHNVIRTYIPQVNAGINGEGIQWGGRPTGQLIANYQQNTASACNYLGGGGAPCGGASVTDNLQGLTGTWTPPLAPFGASGVWKNLLLGFSAPEASVIAIGGCKQTVGCNAFDADFNLVNWPGSNLGLGPGGGLINLYPQTDTMMIQAGAYNSSHLVDFMLIGADVTDLNQNIFTGTPGHSGMSFNDNAYLAGLSLGAQSSWSASTPVTGILGTGANLLSDDGSTIAAGKTLTVAGTLNVTGTCTGCGGSGVAAATVGQVAVYTASTTVGGSSTPSVTNLTVLTGIAGTNGNTYTPGTGAGTGATVSCYQGVCDSIGGTLTLVTGTSPAASSAAITVAFANTRSHIPACIVQPSLTGGAGLYTTFTMTESTTGFVFGSGTTALAASTTYRVRYICEGN